VVGRPATGSPRVVGKRRSALEQLAGLDHVEEEGQAPIRLSSPGAAQRGCLQPLLCDGPVEKASEDPDKVVEAAGSGPGPRCEERVDQGGSQLAQVRDTMLVGKGQEQTQRRLLGLILAAEGPFVGEELGGGGGEVVVHGRTASPSPRATSRSASTATLA